MLVQPRNFPLPRTIAYAAIKATMRAGTTLPTVTIRLLVKYLANSFSRTSL
ncbi:hypothetical protein D3C85_1843460 [compost metagenome]